MKTLIVLVLVALLVGAMADLASADRARAADAPRALVVGANGRTGRPLVKILKDRGYYVRASVRDAAEGAGLGADDVAVADVTKPETLPAAVKGMTYVVVVIGAGRADPQKVEYDGTVALVDAAKAAGAKQFVLMTSVGAEITSPDDPSTRFGPMMILKGKAEAYVRKSGISYTIVRPGGLSDCDSGKSGIALGNITAAQYKIAGPPPICRADVALVIAETLGNPNAQHKTFTAIAAPNDPPGRWKTALAALPRD